MTKAANTPTNDNKEELDNLWEDMDESELDDMDPVITPCMVPPINGDAATIECLTNNESKKNLGLRVQPDRQRASQLGKRKEKWKNGLEK